VRNKWRFNADGVLTPSAS